MLDTITICLASLSLVAVVIVIGWQLILKKHLSVLGQRVLESEDIGRIIQAADKVGSFESRMAGCENKADESKKRLAENETKLSGLIAKQEACEERMDKNSTDLARTLENMTSFNVRFDEFENNIGEKLNQLLELESKVNELVSRLESVEQITSRNEIGLADAGRSIKAMTDEIEILQKFQTATEKAHSLIQAAFTDMRTNVSPEENQEIKLGITEPEQISNESEDVHGEAEDQRTSGTYNLEF
jgi:chromosome segregation ATPase